MAKILKKVHKTAVLSFFWAHVHKLEASVQEGDRAGFYRRLKTMNLEGKRDHNSQFIKDEALNSFATDGSGGCTTS